MFAIAKVDPNLTKLRMLRNEFKMSLNEIAYLIGVSEPTICKWLNERYPIRKCYTRNISSAVSTMKRRRNA